MPIWSKLREELDRAGRAAERAIDEGRVRLDMHRAKQRADRSAQALGYALFRARKQGQDVEPELYARWSSEIAAAEADVERFRRQLEEGRPPLQSAP